MTREPNFKRLVKIEDAAVFLGVSRARCFQLARSDTLPVVRLGRSVRIAMSALEDFVANGGKGLNSGTRSGRG